MSLVALMLALPATAGARGERGGRGAEANEARAHHEQTTGFAHRDHDRFGWRAVRAAHWDGRSHRRHHRAHHRHGNWHSRRHVRHESARSRRTAHHADRTSNHRAIQAVNYCRPCREGFQSRERLRHHVYAHHHVPFWRLGFALSPHGVGWVFFG
jgi:hypothetical protein